MREQLTADRKALFWWFRWPANPYVCVSFSVDSSATQAYLARLTAEGQRISVHHVVTAAVSRVLQEYPKANRRLAHGRLYPRRKTGLAMPVDLQAAVGGQEVAMAVVDDTAGLSLAEIAARSQRVIRAERAGHSELDWLRWLTRVADQTPYALLAPVLTAFAWLARLPPVHERLFGDLPGSGVTNVGAAVRLPEGLLFRGGSMAIPQRLMHIGSVWGVSTIQDEVIAIQGAPRVRPMLPMVLCFDHRLFDGVFAGKLIVRFGQMLLHPEAEFGREGTRRGGGGPQPATGAG